MLAVPAAPFDAPEYSFEIKWDGIRALAAVETAGWRLWGRQRANYTDHYPELEVLCRLRPGTLVDGGPAPWARFCDGSKAFLSK
jgi:bifunctional non-homologous end joining protein LigD